jgi:hypothetical protein
MASSIEQLDTFAPSTSFRPCAAVYDVPNVAPESAPVPAELSAETDKKRESA